MLRPDVMYSTFDEHFGRTDDHTADVDVYHMF